MFIENNLRIIRSLLKNNGHNFREYKNRIIGKLLSIIYKGLQITLPCSLAHAGIKQHKFPHHSHTLAWEQPRELKVLISLRSSEPWLTKY